MVEMINHAGGSGTERRTDLRLAFKASRYPALSALMDDPKYSNHVLLAAAEIGAIYLLASDEERTQMLSGLSARIKADFDESVERVASSSLIAEDEPGSPKPSPTRQGTSSFPRQSQTSPSQPHNTASQAVPIFNRNRSSPADGQFIPRGINSTEQVRTQTPPPQMIEPQSGTPLPGASRILDLYSSTFTSDSQVDE